MEKKTMGAFLAALRKAKGMTQQEVADRLNISNKTVSKWERDEGCPEIMMLPAIAELYEVTTDEILRGERIYTEEKREIRNQQIFQREESEKDRANKSLKAYTNIYCIVSIITFAMIAVGMLISILFSYSVAGIVSVTFSAFPAFAPIVAHIICFVALKDKFKAEGSQADKEVLIKSQRTYLKCLCLNITAMTVAAGYSITLLLGELVLPVASFITIPIWIFPGLLISCAAYAIIDRMWNGRKEPTEEEAKAERKHKRLTAAVICLVWVIVIGATVGYSFYEAYRNTFESYCFTSYGSNDFETQDEAVNEYNKLRNHVVKCEELYYYCYGFEDELTLKISDMNNLFTKTADGYQKNFTQPISKLMFSQMKEKTFSTAEEMEEFIYKYVWNKKFSLDRLGNNIQFDDSTHTVSWQNEFEFDLDTEGVLIMIIISATSGCSLSFVIVATSWILRKRKRCN